MISTRGAKRAAQQLSVVGADVRLNPRKEPNKQCTTMNQQRDLRAALRQRRAVRGMEKGSGGKSLTSPSAPSERWRRPRRHPPRRRQRASATSSRRSRSVLLVLWSDSPARVGWSAGGLEMRTEVRFCLNEARLTYCHRRRVGHGPACRQPLTAIGHKFLQLGNRDTGRAVPCPYNICLLNELRSMK
jgi:hypothetical protein